MNEIELCVLTKHHRPNDLKEWVTYHLSLGFDAINIYDNDSHFSINKLFETNKKVNVISKPGALNQSDLYSQIGQNKRLKVKWLGFFDDDEFIYLKNKKNIKDILNNNYPAISIYGKSITSSEIIEDRQDTLINTFIKVRKIEGSSQVKSFVNLEKGPIIWRHNPHLPVNIRVHTVDGLIVEKAGRVLESDFFDNNSAFYYHYYFQSWADWLYKSDRGMVGDTRKKRPYSKDRSVFINAIKNFTETDISMKEKIGSITQSVE